MTRTNKWDGESHHDSHYFTHNHPFNQAPNNIKKQGAGKSNWGQIGSEIDDLIDDESIPPVFNKERRGSNQSLHEEKFKFLQKESVDRLGEEDIEEDE